MFSLVTKCFVSESVSTEQRPAEFRTPLYVVLATPLVNITERIVVLTHVAIIYYVYVLYLVYYIRT